MKRLLICLLVVLALTLSGCGYSEAELAEAWDEGYNAGYDEGWASALRAPEGSIIDKDYRTIQIIGDYVRQEMLLLVQNVGGDGAITVHFQLEIPDMEKPFEQSKKIYLRRGEEKNVSFSFTYYKDVGYKERVWCTSP